MGNLGRLEQVLTVYFQRNDVLRVRGGVSFGVRGACSRFPEWRVLRGHWFQSARKPTHSNTEQAERQPIWVFAPNEPIFRFRSIRRVAVTVSVAATDSGVSSFEILEKGYVSTRGSSSKGC